MDLEVSSMQMILHSGNSRNDSYEAIKLAKQKKFDEANEKIKSSVEELLLAQQEHASVLRDLAESGVMDANLLLVHAEDHVSVSEMSLDMAKEIIDLYMVVGGVKEF